MPLESLAEILRIAGVNPPAPGQLEITGADPVLPVRSHRHGRGGFARCAGPGGRAAVGVARRARAARRGRCARGRDLAAQREISAHRRQAAARVLGSVERLLSGASDGWISIHCNFPDHRDAALARRSGSPRNAPRQSGGAELAGRGAGGRHPCRRAAARATCASAARMGEACAGAGRRRAAAARDRAHRRRTAGTVAARRRGRFPACACSI